MLEEIIKYIADSFDTDDNIVDKPLVHKSYLYAHDLDGNEVLIYPLNDTPVNTDYDGNERTTYIPIQITCVCRDQTIGSTDLSAQEAANYYLNKIKSIMATKNIMLSIDDIYGCSRANTSYSVPYEEGSEYYVGIIRYDIRFKD